MRRFLIIIEILIACLFFLKLITATEMVRYTNAAESKVPVTKEVPPPSKEKDSLGAARTLYAALEERRIALEKREEALKKEEQRLLAIKKEISDKLEELRAKEEKINGLLAAAKAEENKRLKELAKVLESTPPAKAGIMLEQLDAKTAAGITMNMKKDKAGIIWGYLSPQKAIEITREITKP